MDERDTQREAQADEDRVVHVVATIDTIAQRLKLYAGTVLLVGSLIAALTTLAVRWATRDVRAEVAAARSEVRALARVQQERASADSLRFERVLDIVELAVGALVEPEGSDEQRRAVADLRARRHVTPRQ